MKNNMNDFQESLQDLLIENNLNNVKLAGAIGVSEDTISGYFVDGYYPNIDIAIKMGKYLNCSLDFLFGLSDNRYREYDFESVDILTNFNNNFAMQLKNLGVSNAKAMKDLKMGEYTMYRWRKGVFPKTINLIAIAKYLGLSIDYLLGNNE